MRVPAIRFRGAGGVEVIEVGETEVREPGWGEVVVEVVAAGVNRADLLQRRGLYPAPPGAPPDVPGLEFAGRVAARGPGATMWPEGAPVMAITAGGGMARRIVVHERELMPVPAGLDLVTAAAIPEVFLTAWDALVGQARLAAGEDVLIHAVASGVGTAAVQLARAIGARPLGTSRTAAKLPRLVELGLAPDDAIVPEAGRFAAAVAGRTGGAGAAVILDCVGAAYFEENLRALATRGRLVLLGLMGGATGAAPLGLLLGKRATVIGTVLRARPLEEKIAIARGATAHLVPLFERGLLVPVIDAVLPMTACAEAHARVERDETVGKVVLAWDPAAR
ncbi:MAG: NAD(P)H-quinone oxidoreductase [Myxococcales bacterium]|nr:NAD(P)H-quinone oxidoreductase [Myxococcales bacterium]